MKCQISGDEMIATSGHTPYEPQWLGGISGAPIWTLVQGVLFSWRLAGVIVEYSEDYGILIATRSDVIAPDGRIVRE